MKQLTCILYIDGDGVGARIDGAVVEGDLVTAARLSASVSRATEEIARRLEEQGAQIIFAGGDNILARAGVTDEQVERLLEYFEENTGIPASAGIGLTSSDAYLALKAAKRQGGGRVYWWNRRTAEERRVS